jgi:hypothetical protein
MIKRASSRTPKSGRAPRAESPGGFQEVERLINLTGELTAAAEDALKGRAAGEAEAPGPKARLTAFSAAICARKQLEEITGLKIDSVSAVSKAESGWDVVINALELPRIPHSTDVLASFTVRLDDEGNLENYHRTVRYMRDQVGDDL